MKALLTPRFAIEKAMYILAFLPLISLVYPEIGLAANMQLPTGQDNQALVFQIKSQNQSTLSYEQIIQKDPLTLKVQKYLSDRNSPLADSAPFIVSHNNWKRALAISVVESNMCIHTPKYMSNGAIQESHNCSGIGGDSLRRYASYEEWFDDMSNLLNKPNYANRPIEKFIGYYVVPGGMNWLNGVRKTENDFNRLEEEAKEERLAMGYTTPVSEIATAATTSTINAQ
jgi:hypothetical protein